MAGVSVSSVSHASCPSANIKSVIATLLPEIPSAVRSLLPSDVLAVIAADTRMMSSRTAGVMGAPSVTGATGAAGRLGGSKMGKPSEGFMGIAVGMSVVIGGLAVLL
jgi:hypothetical protein